MGRTSAARLPIHFITVNYHCGDFIRGLIEAIGSSADDPESLRFVVVNNSPADRSLREWIDTSSLPLPVRLIEAGANLGFGSGCNLGLRHVWQTDRQAVAWLINPDARLDEGAITYVRQCLRDDDLIALLGTRIRDPRGTVWFSHGSFNRWTGQLGHRFPGDDCRPLPVRTWPTRWISGCSMIFRLGVLRDCPQFDPRYFLDYEDADISERHHRLGYRLRVTQAVLVEHQVSAITQRAPRAKYQHATFSKLYFLHRHATPLALLLNLLYYAVRPLSFCLSDPERARGRWWGLGDYLRWCWWRLLRRPDPPHPRTSFTVSS
ncbi:glycosyltransferase family 2 protein [Cyanobium gracile UHCC 0139]|uniref:Glycosyltransferase family 2 protein n=1 Tax=Cyanobium gracile UHCC 0139 TaxID=3110308 RepID=A0ABU5RUI0_9CYAN|nr:glycosyltransferase family 2 protein [Cyanobium gracile]MEA5391393.1 glycosyltransferase family 2 protein [Cyanobium gracile UHCC 0139]